MSPSDDYDARKHNKVANCFMVYSFTPEKDGYYALSFSDIEISKVKEQYRDNNLFDVYVMNVDEFVNIGKILEEKALMQKKIYVNGENATGYKYLSGGEEYIIFLASYAEPENSLSEIYRNGDIRYSICMYAERQMVDITGFTKITDYTRCAGEWTMYSVKPCRKQNITFTFSEGEGTFNVYVFDESGSCIMEYTELEKGDSFELKDTMVNYRYRFRVIGKNVTDYVIDVDYQ